MNELILKYQDHKENIVVKDMIDLFGKKNLESWGLSFQGDFLAFETHYSRSVSPERLFMALILSPKFKANDDFSKVFTLKFSRKLIKEFTKLKESSDLMNSNSKYLSLLSMSPLDSSVNANLKIDKFIDKLSQAVTKTRKELILTKSRSRLFGIFDK